MANSGKADESQCINMGKNNNIIQAIKMQLRNYIWTEPYLIYFYSNSFKSLIVQYAHAVQCLLLEVLRHLLWQIIQPIHAPIFFTSEAQHG